MGIMQPAMSPSIAANTLVLLLRVGGGVMTLAWLAFFMPTEWMVTTNRAVGLPDYPGGPLLEYLARSASLLYGIHGGLFLVLSTDVRRYAPVIRYVGVTDVVFGALVTGLDWWAGMPRVWALVEGPSVVAAGLVILVLLPLTVPEGERPRATGH